VCERSEHNLSRICLGGALLFTVLLYLEAIYHPGGSFVAAAGFHRTSLEVVSCGRGQENEGNFMNLLLLCRQGQARIRVVKEN